MINHQSRTQARPPSVTGRTRRVSRGRRALKSVASGLTGLTFIAVMVAGIGIFHVRDRSIALQKANPPVTVATRVIELIDGYDVTESFAGRLEPARQVHAAFERDGLVVAVMFDEGDDVEAGAVIARLDTSLLGTRRLLLQAERRELLAQRDLARATLSRQGTLKKKGWSSHQKYDEARFQAARLEAGIERVDASIKAVEVELDKSRLRAPFAGTVGARLIDEGAVVSAGATVINLLETGNPEARIGVSVEAAGMLKVGRSYRLRANGDSLEGRLISKRPDLQTGTRTVTAQFRVNARGAIPFGEVVELDIERRIEATGAWLPLAALSEGQKGLWTVFTVVERENRSVVGREAVEVLFADDDLVFVRGTFREGARIVLKGRNRIIPGQQVALASGG